MRIKIERHLYQFMIFDYMNIATLRKRRTQVDWDLEPEKEGAAIPDSQVAQALS